MEDINKKKFNPMVKFSKFTSNKKKLMKFEESSIQTNLEINFFLLVP